jgi:16S rRNA processing protein RimM
LTETRNKNTTGPESLPLTESLPLEDSWVRLAQVVRPQGRKGELLAELLTDFPERFAERRRLFLRSSEGAAPREVRLEEHWLHKGRLVLKLEGVESIEDAEPLRGHEVVIPRAERAPLDEDSVYIADLAGCMLYDRASDGVVGEILGVDRESSNMPLIVVRAAGGELLIPFAKAYQPRIDLDGRRMEMTLPEGLLALNDPLTAEERAALAAARAEDGAAAEGQGGPRKKRR